MRIGSAVSVGLVGLKAFTITVQAFVSQGLPNFSIIGLPDTSLSEARERVRAASSSTGYHWPQTRVTVNLSPASLPKRGSAHDLAIAIAVMSASGVFTRPRTRPALEPDSTLLLGELNLDGSVLPINGLLPILLFAKDHGFNKVIVPQGNLAEGSLVGGIELYGVTHLNQAISLLGGGIENKNGRQEETAGRQPVRPGTDTTVAVTQAEPPQGEADEPAEPADEWRGPRGLLASQQADGDSADSTGCRLEQAGASDISLDAAGTAPPGDMSQVIGQDAAKRSLEVAAAGGHHLLMSGPPGSGKTMLASRLPGIMPELDEQEALEVASIRSLCGSLPHYGLSTTPPFEAPHHTASSAALAGGGAGVAQPGAITRAHCGVLFLDEAPEFATAALQILREPLETGTVTLLRSKSVTVYPARFLLVMAANPCPCGNYWGKADSCTCSVRERMRYWGKLSGPLLDRIDIQIDVPPVRTLPPTSSPTAEPSVDIRRRVVQARAVARERFSSFGWTCNAQAEGQWLRNNTGGKALAPISAALNERRVSLRGADRALRLAWTIADLAGRTCPDVTDVAEGLSMRTRR